MVNAAKINFSSLPAGKYGKSTKSSTQRWHQGNQGKPSLESERVRALGALRSFRSMTELAANQQLVMQFLHNKVNDKWIDDYVQRESTGAWMRVDDSEAVIRQ